MHTLQKTLEQQLIEELQGLASELESSIESSSESDVESGKLATPIAARQPARNTGDTQDGQKKPRARRNGQVLRRAEAIAEQRQAAARQAALPL